MMKRMYTLVFWQLESFVQNMARVQEGGPVLITVSSCASELGVGAELEVGKHNDGTMIDGGGASKRTSKITDELLCLLLPVSEKLGWLLTLLIPMPHRPRRGREGPVGVCGSRR